VLAFAPTLDHAGLFTRTAGEMAWLWATVAGNPQASAVAHRRLAWLRWPIESELEPEMALGFEQAIVTLARAGFEIQEIPLPASFQQLPGATMTVFQYEGAQTNKDRFQQYGLRIGEKLAALVENGLRIDDGRYEQALAQLEEARQAFARSVREHPVWITPSALGPAPVGLASTGVPRANAPFTALGVPAISLPFGKTTSGLPLGLQLAAGCGQESGLLATAAECEKGLAEQDGQARE
jgi:Asp-tRNA(Asn)/Glu-tRNA(Gln) amidotransferase A subunit family amidase